MHFFLARRRGGRQAVEPVHKLPSAVHPSQRVFIFNPQFTIVIRRAVREHDARVPLEQFSRGYAQNITPLLLFSVSADSHVCEQPNARVSQQSVKLVRDILRRRVIRSDAVTDETVRETLFLVHVHANVRVILLRVTRTVTIDRGIRIRILLPRIIQLEQFIHRVHTRGTRTDHGKRIKRRCFGGIVVVIRRRRGRRKRTTRRSMSPSRSSPTVVVSGKKCRRRCASSVFSRETWRKRRRRRRRRLSEKEKSTTKERRRVRRFRRRREETLAPFHTLSSSTRRAFVFSVLSLFCALSFLFGRGVDAFV